MKTTAITLLLVLTVSSTSSYQTRNSIIADDDVKMIVEDDDLTMRDLSQTDDRFIPTKNQPCFGQYIPSSAPVTSYSPWDNCSDEGGDGVSSDGDDGGMELNAGTLGPFFSPVSVLPPAAALPTLGPSISPPIVLSAPAATIPSTFTPAPVTPPAMLPALVDSTAPTGATEAPGVEGFVFNFNFTTYPTPNPSMNPTPTLTIPFKSMEPSTDSPTEAISHWPTQTPLPTLAPWLAPAFYDPHRRQIIKCEISCALPMLSRRRRRLQQLRQQQQPPLLNGPRKRHDFDESDDGDQQIMDLNAAKRFKREVADVIVQVISESTNITVLRENGFRRQRYLREYRPPSDYIPYDGIQIVVSNLYTNVTRISTPGPRPDSIWWLYSVGFWTVEENVTLVHERIVNATQAAVRSGEVLQRLRPRFQRIIAVALPGREKDVVIQEGNGLPGDGNVLELREWDTRRWIGLALFLCTLIGTLALTRIATQRRKKVREQEEWGVGLSSETDINQLLTYGWEFRGQQVHTFDKSKLVYRDDDSIFIGGAVALAGEMAPTVPLTSSSQTRESQKTNLTPSSQTQSYLDDPSSGMGTQQDSVQSHSDEKNSSSGGS